VNRPRIRRCPIFRTSHSRESPHTRTPETTAKSPRWQDKCRSRYTGCNGMVRYINECPLYRLDRPAGMCHHNTPDIDMPFYPLQMRYGTSSPRPSTRLIRKSLLPLSSSVNAPSMKATTAKRHCDHEFKSVERQPER
jgi:hypothetical protein